MKTDPPFEAATSKCRWYAPLAAGNAREFWKQHRGCGIPSPAKDLITRMLWKDKDKRITITGIKKHRWYNGEKLRYVCSFVCFLCCVLLRALGSVLLVTHFFRYKNVFGVKQENSFLFQKPFLLTLSL